MIKTWYKLGMVLFCWLWGAVACAAGPVAVLQTAANQMIAALAAHQSQLSSHPKLVNQIVRQNVVPYVDVNRMGGLVVGRANWMSATPSQRAQFISAFTELVINTYAAAFASYDGDQVMFYPLRTQPTNVAHVDSVIVRKNGQRIAISYDMNTVGGNWRIYDFSIEGVSIVQNYQSQFASTLANGGMPVLITRLQAYGKANS